MDAIYITSNQNKDLLVHEIDVEKGMDKFSKDVAQFEEDQVWMKKSVEYL